VKTDRIYVDHILECIRRIESDVAGGESEFSSNRTIQDAVLRNLQILAESSQRISPEAKARYPEIEWRNIGGFRNRLVHDYFNIDLALVWRVISIHLPSLKDVAERLAKEMDNP
jgi:uncharacterized protein with HEPN domain